MIKKLFLVALALLLVAGSAYAMEIPTMSNVKAASETSNVNRDFVDTIVRYFPDDRTSAAGAAGNGVEAINAVNTPTASQGMVVVWATQPRAILGRDVTVTAATDSPMVAGVVSEANGIASGSFGRIRIYGYMYNVLGADSTDGYGEGGTLGTAGSGTGTATSARIGRVGAGAGVGVALEAGNGADTDEVQTLINIDNSAY